MIKNEPEALRLVSRKRAQKFNCKLVASNHLLLWIMLKNLWHTMLGMKWWHIGGILTVVWTLLNLIFGLLFFAQVWRDNTAIVELHRQGDSVAWVLAKCFYFSMQTGHGIGFGFWFPASVYSNIVVTLDVFVFVIFESFLMAIMFSKMARPSLLRNGILFTNHAVVSWSAPYWYGGDNGGLVADGKYPSVQFRLTNAAMCMLSQPSFRLLLLRQEGPGRQWRIHELNFDINYGRGRVRSAYMSEPYLGLPWTVTHTMDPWSPLFQSTPEDLEETHSEIIAVVEGTNEANSSVVQARWSYVAHEIIWRAKFDSCVAVDEGQGKYVVNMRRFNTWTQEPEQEGTLWDPYPRQPHHREASYVQRSPALTETPSTTASVTEDS